MQDALDDVAIFWDYENCSPPCSVPGYDVVNNIREIALAYGSVKLFKAYLELSEQSSSKSIGLRSELQSCGVSLTDCPHNGRKDVADKMMIVDMLTYAIDNPAPATIVLISGDRDFVYAVSVLRLRRYRVVLVAPNTAHASLKSQATTVLDWEADIMRRTTMRPQTFEASHAASDETLQQRSPRRPPLSFGGPLPQLAPKSARRPSFKVNTPLTPVTPLDVGNRPGAGSFFQGRHLRNPSIVTTDESLPPNAASRCGASYDMAGGHFFMGDADLKVDCTPIQDIVDVMREIRERRGSQSPINRSPAEPSSTPSSSPSATSTSSVKPPVSDSSQSPAASSPTDSPIKSQIIAKSTEQSENGLAPPNQQSPLVSPKPVTFPPMAFEPVLRPATVGSLSRLPGNFLSPSMPDMSFPEETVHSAEPRPTTGSVAQSASLDQTGRAPATCSFSTEESFPVEHTTGSTDISVTDGALLAPFPEPAAQSRENDDVSPSPENTLAWIPAHFHPLVGVLEEMRLAGIEQPLRTTVAVRLSQVAKGIYKATGKGTFKEYSAAAVQAGLVVLGGIQGYAWISLSPEWHGKVPVTAPAC